MNSMKNRSKNETSEGRLAENYKASWPSLRLVGGVLGLGGDTSLMVFSG